MTIRFNNGVVKNAVLLTRAAQTLRVAVNDSDDVVELNQKGGVWVTDDCEPVQIEFAWEKTGRKLEEVTEADCICAPELAARLIHLLFTGDPESATTPAPALAAAAGVGFLHQVV